VSVQREAPRQLKLPWRPSVNRKQELADFRSAERVANAGGTPLLTAFTGLEGVGKTTLARMACQEVKDHYPDAQLYYEFLGSEPDAELTAVDAATFFLSSLGVSGEEMPARDGERITMLRSLLSGRKALIFLDDVTREDQVLPFLFDSPASAVVVTSRRPMSGLRRAGFTLAEVRPFGDDDARELFGALAGERLAGIESTVVKGLRTVCEGLPVALSVVAMRLSEAEEEPEDYLAELSGDRLLDALELDGDRPVLRIFELTYQELGADEARAYALLSVLPGPHFGTGVAAEVLGMSEVDTQRLLRGLTRRYVLERIGNGRFRFHSLIRAHARDRARAAFSPTDIASTVNAARWWYWRRQVALDKALSSRPFPIGAQTYYESIDPAFTGTDVDGQAWAEVEREWPNLLAAMKEGGAQPDDELTPIFPLALWFFAYQTRRCTELIDAYHRALERETDPARVWQLNRDLAGLYERCGEPDAADKCIDRAALAGYEPGTESLYTWYGLAKEARGDLPGALAAFERAQDAVRLMGDPVQEARATALLHMHVGRVRYAAGEYEPAAAFLTGAREYFHERNEPVNRARAELDLGRSLAGSGRRTEAIPLLESAFETFRSHSMRDKAAEAADELTWIADVDGRADEVESWRESARDLRGER
jgi:tetratricopeptide (TPR) repeat protein